MPRDIEGGLRNENERLRKMLRDRDMAEHKAKMDQIDREQRTADATAKAERMEAAAATLERIRRGSWTNHKLESQMNAGGGQMPFSWDWQMPDGWPPGDGPHLYHIEGMPVVGKIPEAKKTSMHKALEAQGVKL